VRAQPGANGVNSWTWLGILVGILVCTVLIHDLFQKDRAILRNFPLIGLVPEVGARRIQGYVDSFRNELMAVTHASGYSHPGQYTPHDVEISAGPGIFKSLYEIYGYRKAQFTPDADPTFKEPDEELAKKMVRRLSLV
jgi:hypothetical protein